jgi:hypothetical protein
VTAAIFGLLGVIVGAAMQGTATWLMERRRENWAARKSGRLLARALTRCRFILEVAKEGPLSWGLVAEEIDGAMQRWPEHADVLAGTIVNDDDWFELGRAVDWRERIQQRGRAAPDEVI